MNIVVSEFLIMSRTFQNGVNTVGYQALLLNATPLYVCVCL